MDEAGMIASFDTGNDPSQEIGTSLEVTFLGDHDPTLFRDFSLREVLLAESLLTPGLQTSIRAQSYVHNIPIKWWDILKGQLVNIKIKRPILEKFGYPTELEVEQTTYRLGGRSATAADGIDNRKMHNRVIEDLVFHACDQSLLNDAANLVSKSWKCETPTSVTEYVLRHCAGVKNFEKENSDPARDYIAENIHPFQVVTQQANAALASGNDPSFVHYMTYENKGTHHFKSLKKLSQQAPIITLYFNYTGSSYSIPNSIMNYVFPCDFDLLSDVLNGVNQQGSDINSLATFDPATKSFNMFGNQDVGCGIGGGVYKIAQSNQQSAANRNMCPDFVSTYLQKRQARMTLLEKDKIALRLVVPWNPIYNVGKTLEIKLINTEDQSGSLLNYGSGKYLIVSLIHNIKVGGYSTITLDCVSETVGQGGEV